MDQPPEVQIPDVITADFLIEQYVKVRDAIEKISAEYEAKLAPYNAALKTLGDELMAECNRQNASSIKTPFGMAIRSLKSEYKAEDMGLFLPWVAETRNVDLLERRVSSGKVKEFVESSGGTTPPGLRLVQSYSLSVRRPSTK